MEMDERCGRIISNSLPVGVKNNIVDKGDSRLFIFDSQKTKLVHRVKRWRLNPFETASGVFIAGPAEIDDPSAGIP